MAPMMCLSLLMSMRYYFKECVVRYYILSQSLLDGDLEMEDGEIESKVSVSVALSVYSLCRLPLRIVW